MSALEKRVTSLEREVKTLKAIVEKLTAESDPVSPPPVPLSHTSLEFSEREANAKETNSVKAAVTGYIKQESHNKYYKVDKAKKLGTGMNGAVYAVTDASGASFAIKSVSKRRMSKAQVKGIRTEISLLSRLDHPNVVKLVEAFEEPTCLTMILEICSGGELYDNLIEQEIYSEGLAKNVFRQMVSAVGYVHQMGIAHRDLKLENFLFESKEKDALVKLIDFGLSKKYGIQRMTTLVGTAYYIAPEILLHQDCYGPLCDVWSLGVILFMMLSGWPPFGGDDDRQIMRNIKRNEVDFNCPEKGYWDKMPGAQKLLRKMLTKDAKSRPSCAQILADPWMKEKNSAPIAKGVLSNLRQSVKIGKLRQATAQVVALNLPADQIRQIQASFKSLDKDASGHISFEEFKTGLQDRGMDDAEITKLFAKVDIDATGLISYSEFLSAALTNSKLMTKKRILQTFDRLDKDSSGSLSKHELEAVLSGIIDQSEVDKVLEAADTNGDGVISRAEFLAAVMSDN